MTLKFATKELQLDDSLDMLTKRKAQMIEVIERYRNSLALQEHFDPNNLNLDNLPHVREAYEEYDKSLTFFEAAIAFQAGKASAHYHTACVYGRQNEIDRAMLHLESAANSGFANSAIVERDWDLERLRNSFQYKKLLAILGENARKQKIAIPPVNGQEP